MAQRGCVMAEVRGPGSGEGGYQALKLALDRLDDDGGWVTWDQRRAATGRRVAARERDAAKARVAYMRARAEWHQFLPFRLRLPGSFR